MIDLKALGVFLTVVECGSFTLAAKRLGRSQSAVSQSVRELEHDLGVVLIDRASRPLAATASGTILREHANRLIRDAEALSAKVLDGTGAKVPEIRIGLVDSFAAAVGPALMKTLLEHAVNLTVHSGLTSNLAESFVQRKVDIIVGNDPMEEVDGLDRHELMREPYLVLVPASMPTAPGDAGLAKLARDYPMICYNPESFLGAQIARQLANRDIRATRRVSVDTSDSLVAMVAAGIGWTSTTPLCLLLARPYLPRVRVLPFPGPRFSRRLTLVSRSGEHSALAARLARIAVQILGAEVRADLKQLLPGLQDRITLAARPAAPDRERNG
jgi:DNA-binding transcriptional LysR family regulator